MADELAAQRPAVPRIDEASADMQTLVDMGLAEEQPEPPPEPEPVPEE